MKDQKLFEYFEISNPRVQSKSQENLEKLYFFMQGVAALLPWSSILCTLDFYSAKFPSDDTSFTFPVAFFVSGVGFNFLMVYIKRRLSLNVRVIGGLLLLLVFLILLPLIAQNSANSTKGLWTCLLLLFLIGIANTVSNASVAGLSGHFPAFCRSVHSTGAGIAALITNIIRVFIIIFSDSPNPATDIREIMFFYGAAVLLLIAGIVLHVMFVQSNPTMAQLEQPKENNNETQQIQHNFHHQWNVFKETPFWVTAMFISNTQTFMLYPGVLFKKPLDFTDFTWTIILISAVFNISDTIGKYVSFKAIFLQKKVIMWMVASRFLFFIFFLWPLINPDVALLGQSWFLLLMVAIFGFTNGLILSAVFIMAPEEVQGEKKEIAGFLAFNAMMIGIMSGSFLALIFSSL